VIRRLGIAVGASHIFSLLAFGMVPIRMHLIMGALEPSMMPILVPLIMVVFVP